MRTKLTCGVGAVLLLAAFSAHAQTSGAPPPQPSDAPQAPPATPGEVSPSGTAKPKETGAVPTPAQQAKAEAPSPAPIMAKWGASFFGFLEFDSIYDTTQSLSDTTGATPIARPDTYAGKHPRATFGVRNSRFGFRLSAPEFDGIRASGFVEADFLGNQPTGLTEVATFTNATFRLRHYIIKMENPYVDLWFGQTWQLFGWQPYSHPNTVEIQGMPGEIFSRATQLRLTHTFKTSPVNLEVAVAAARPPQRDGARPDGVAGLRLNLNKWKGIRTGGGTATAVEPAALGVSGVLRRFDVPEFAEKPKADKVAYGSGYAVDVFLPVLGTTERKAHALSLTGEFSSGAGINDLYSSLTGGVTFPALPNPTGASPAPTYSANIDPGLVSFDSSGKLVPIQWQAFIVGFQYYLPPSGRFWLAGMYSRLQSSNAGQFGDPKKVFTREQWADGCLFFDATQAVRFGLEYAWFENKYADGQLAHNHRAQLSGWYIF